MKLAIFDELRLGIVSDDGIVDVTEALPWRHDADGLTAGWWRRLCRDYAEAKDGLAAAAARGDVLPLNSVRLGAPVLNPSKIIASASNYRDHVEEMHAVRRELAQAIEAALAHVRGLAR